VHEDRLIPGVVLPEAALEARRIGRLPTREELLVNDLALRDIGRIFNGSLLVMVGIPRDARVERAGMIAMLRVSPQRFAHEPRTQRRTQ
jgi:hypothetical protein